MTARSALLIKTLVTQIARLQPNFLSGLVIWFAELR